MEDDYPDYRYSSHDDNSLEQKAYIAKRKIHHINLEIKKRRSFDYIISKEGLYANLEMEIEDLEVERFRLNRLYKRIKTYLKNQQT